MSYNPFSGWRITGTWADHLSYSLGGTDYPLPFGTALPAPASGTLRTSGGTGERRAGLIGSAGRRSILDLDKPLGAMVAIVFQHQSRFGVDGKHYNEGETLGWSGASTIRSNGTVNEWGSDVHLHIHGLDKNGNRVEFEKHIGSSETSGSKPSQIVTDTVARILKGETMIVKRSATGEIGIFGADFAQPNGFSRGRHVFESTDEYNAYKAITDTVRSNGGVAVTLPAITSPQIVGLDETGWRVVCGVHGV